MGNIVSYHLWDTHFDTFQTCDIALHCCVGDTFTQWLNWIEKYHFLLFTHQISYPWPHLISFTIFSFFSCFTKTTRTNILQVWPIVCYMLMHCSLSNINIVLASTHLPNDRKKENTHKTTWIVGSSIIYVTETSMCDSCKCLERLIVARVCRVSRQLRFEQMAFFLSIVVWWPISYNLHTYTF